MQLNENQIFWSNIEKIKDGLLLGDVEFAKDIGLNYKKFSSLRNLKKIVPSKIISELAEKWNFKHDDLFDENFNFKYSPTDAHTLRDRYNVATYSHTRPINNILNYLEITRGRRAKIKLLNHFQISEDFINQPDNKANILLITDIVDYLSRSQQFNQKDFLAIGQQMPFIASNDVLKTALNKHTKAINILECFIYDCTRLFDSNFSYKISSHHNDQAVIEMIPNKHVMEELRGEAVAFKSVKVCLTRMGNMSAVTYFRYGRNADIKLISSLHTGAVSSKCLVDLTPFKKMDGLKDFKSSAGIFYQSKKNSRSSDLIH